MAKTLYQKWADKIFGKRAPMYVDVPQEEIKQEDTDEQLILSLETWVIETIFPLLKEQEKKLAEYNAQILKEIEIHSFECKRYGEFLSIEQQTLDKKVLFAVKLDGCDRIHLVPEELPDLKGEITVSGKIVYEPDYRTNSFYRGPDILRGSRVPYFELPNPDQKWVQKLRHSEACKKYSMNILGFARKPRKPIIYIGKVKITLPIGKGEECYNKVLQALET